MALAKSEIAAQFDIKAGAVWIRRMHVMLFLASISATAFRHRYTKKASSRSGRLPKGPSDEIPLALATALPVSAPSLKLRRALLDLGMRLESYVAFPCCDLEEAPQTWFAPEPSEPTSIAVEFLELKFQQWDRLNGAFIAIDGSARNSSLL